MKTQKVKPNFEVLATDKQWLTKEEVFFFLGKMDGHKMYALRQSKLIRWQVHPFFEKKFLYNKQDIINLLNDTSKIDGRPDPTQYQETPDVANW